MGAVMTAYELCREISDILSEKHSDELFDYIIHSMDDDGGFLRSRFCYWDKTLRDRNVGEVKTALVATQRPFDFENCTDYYFCDVTTGGKSTIMKMQIYYYDLSDEKEFAARMRVFANVTFCCPIKVDLVNRSYEILPELEPQ